MWLNSHLQRKAPQHLSSFGLSHLAELSRNYHFRLLFTEYEPTITEFWSSGSTCCERKWSKKFSPEGRNFEWSEPCLFGPYPFTDKNSRDTNETRLIIFVPQHVGFLRDWRKFPLNSYLVRSEQNVLSDAIDSTTASSYLYVTLICRKVQRLTFDLASSKKD